MSLLYVFYGVVWLIVSACQWRDLLRIQVIIIVMNVHTIQIRKFLPLESLIVILGHRFSKNNFFLIEMEMLNI